MMNPTNIYFVEHTFNVVAVITPTFKADIAARIDRIIYHIEFYMGDDQPIEVVEVDRHVNSDVNKQIEVLNECIAKWFDSTKTEWERIQFTEDEHAVAESVRAAINAKAGE